MWIRIALSLIHELLQYDHYYYMGYQMPNGSHDSFLLDHGKARQ